MKFWLTTTQIRAALAHKSPTTSPGGYHCLEAPSGWLDTRVQVPAILRLTAIALFVFPSNMIFGPLGAGGYVAMVLAQALFAMWALSSALRLHDPVPVRHPARVGLFIYWLVGVLSYLSMTVPLKDSESVLAANRWLLSLVGMTGIALVTTESIRNRTAALALVRALVAGATFCAAIAAFQFWTRVNPMPWMESLLIGLNDNGGATDFATRSTLMRVAGTTIHPIELGVVCAMILPLACWRAIYAVNGSSKWRWIQVSVIAFASFASVSRSAVLGLFVAAIVTVPFMPALARKWVKIVLPAGLLGVFVLVPGLIATLVGFFAAGTSDPSVTARTDDYPRVEKMVEIRPWLGSGPGTFLPKNQLEIVDNQYLHSAIEMGMLGVFAVIALLITPAVSSLISALSSKEPSLRMFCGAVAAGCFVALISAVTFDFLSFPVVTLTFCFLLGLAGAGWIAVKSERFRLPVRAPCVELDPPISSCSKGT